MKKYWFFSLMFLSAVSFGAWGDESLINKSSYTTTNDTLVSISSTVMAGGVFDGVVIGSNSATGVVKFYDSNGVQVSTIGVVSMAGTANGAFYIPFEVRLSSGLTYTVTGNPGISIIYKITRPQ